MFLGVLRRVSPAAGIVLLAALGLPKTAFGLDPGRTLTQYVHRIWQIQQGLTQGTISQVLQTREGYLWLATQSGMVRFDGVRFQPAEDIIPGAPANLSIRAALEDQQGALWLGSSELGVFRLASDGVTQYTTAQGLPSNSVQCLVPGRDGAILVCTENGLARVDTSRGEPRIQGPEDPTMASKNIRAACVDPQGSLWIGGDRPAVQHGSRIVSLKGLPASASVRALLCVADTVWVGTSDGLIRIHDNEQHLFKIREGLPDNFVFSLAQGAGGTIWVGTRSGFSRMRDGVLDSFRPQDGLSQSTATAVFEDREGSLWVGTKRGLNQFIDGRAVPYTVSEGLPSNEAGPVLEDHSGVIWAGTLDRGLARFDGQGFRALTTRDGLASNTIYALVEDRDGSLWAGTKDGLNQLRDGRVVATYTVGNGLPGNSIRSLYQDRAGVLWAGTQKGLASFRGGRFEAASGAPRDPVTALSEDREEHIVVATERGVFQGIAADGFRELTVNGSAIRPVNTLYRDSDGLLWMGLNGGGLRMLKTTASGNEISSFLVRDGLYDGEIYGIVRDDQDRLWMACSRGIFWVPRSELRRFAAGEVKKLTSLAYSPTDAQRVIEGQSGVAPVLSMAHDGRLWFSTIRGLLVLDPDHWQRETTAPQVVVESPIVNGHSEPPERIGQMPPGQKNIEFNYAGLAYYLPSRLRFRYMLEGYDRDWIEAGTRRETFYTNLPPGTFRFRVTACNADNLCNPQGATVEFSLAPYFYQRAWFWPLAAAAVAGLGWLVYQLRIRHLRERYDLILAERSRIARELHDTLIQGFSGITMAMQALAGRLRSPQERETLDDIIRDAATCLRETRQSVAGLRSGHDPESGLSAAISAAAREITDTKDVRLKLKLERVLRKLPAEVEYNLLRIASEAVSNSVKHSGARTIEVALESTPEALRLRVHDDGSGLGKDGAALRPGHYGIIGMKERATQIGADLEMLSVPGHGTTVSVLLPAGRASTQPEKVEALS